MRTTHEGVIWANSPAERDRITAERIAAGRFDQRYGALVVPPDDKSIGEWEARLRS